MSYLQVLVPSAVSEEFADLMGREGCLEFTDLNEELQPFQRAFTADIIKIQEIERRLKSIEEALADYNVAYDGAIKAADLEAAKRGIHGEPPENLPRTTAVLRDGWYFPIPFAVLIYALLVWGMRAEYCALLATAVLIFCALAFGFRGHRYSVREVLRAAVSTGGAVVDLILICAVAGMFIGILNITGLAFGLTLQLLSITGESVVVLLLLTAALGVLLGMGMPTVGVYIIMATLIAPALVKAGVPPMAAHLFVLYFGIMSMVTPPVALAAFAAANIAGADPNRTGWIAARIGWSAYVVPFLFVFSPSLLMQGDPLTVAWAALTAAIGVWLGTIGVVGFFYRPLPGWARAAFLAAGVLVLIPADMFPGAIVTDIAGLALGGALLARELTQRKWQPS